MRRETDPVSGVQYIEFAPEYVNPPAVVKLILSQNPYIWIGLPNGGECIGCISHTEMRSLGNAILREMKKARRK